MNATRPANLSSAASIALGAGAAWLIARERDVRAVQRDPAYAELTRPLNGRPLAVRAADGTRLHTEVFGPEDAPTVVLVHGWTCGLRFWQCQLHELGTTHRVVAYDLRGHGSSDDPAAGDFRIETLAGDLEAVLEAAVPPTEQALLVGHSLGAMSIVAWAAEHPDHVRRRAAGTVLINTGIGDLVTESLVVRLPTRLERVKAAVGGLVLGVSVPLPKASPIMHRVVKYVALSPSASPARVAFCQELLLGTRRQARARCGRTLSRLDLAHAVEHLTVPTKVVTGSRDRLTPPSHAYRLAETLPDAEEAFHIDHVGHMAPVEAPETINAAIRDLARRVLPPAPHADRLKKTRFAAA